MIEFVTDLLLLALSGSAVWAVITLIVFVMAIRVAHPTKWDNWY